MNLSDVTETKIILSVYLTNYPSVTTSVEFKVTVVCTLSAITINTNSSIYVGITAQPFQIVSSQT